MRPRDYVDVADLRLCLEELDHIVKFLALGDSKDELDLIHIRVALADLVHNSFEAIDVVANI